MARIFLEIVTPERLLVSEEVDIVTAPGVAGEFGVMAGHAPMVAGIKIGPLHYRVGDKEEWIALGGGFCEVTGKKVSFLVETAERAYEIDVDRALRAKERAEKRLQEAQAKGDRMAEVRARAALQRALTRIALAERATAGHPR